MAICSKCLHKEVCAFRKQTRDSCAESCEDFLGWVKVCDERPIPLKDNVVISDYGLSFIMITTRTIENTFAMQTHVKKFMNVHLIG